MFDLFDFSGIKKLMNDLNRIGILYIIIRDNWLLYDHCFSVLMHPGHSNSFVLHRQDMCIVVPWLSSTLFMTRHLLHPSGLKEWGHFIEIAEGRIYKYKNSLPRALGILFSF